MLLEDRDLVSGLRKKDCMVFPHRVVYSSSGFSVVKGGSRRECSQ